MENMTKDGWRGFLTLCAHLESKEQFDAFFDFFLTHKEKEDLAKRTLIVKELLKGKKTQRQIASDLKLSISKITRGSNALKTINKNLREFLKTH